MLEFYTSRQEASKKTVMQFRQANGEDVMGLREGTNAFWQANGRQANEDDETRLESGNLNNL